MSHGFLIALLAAGAMAVQDVLATIMVQAEAANKGWLAGGMDMLGWYFAITTTSISVNALDNSHGFWPKFWVLSLVGISNVFGTKLGQVTGKKILTRKQAQITRGGDLTLNDKIAIKAASRK